MGKYTVNGDGFLIDINTLNAPSSLNKNSYLKWSIPESILLHL